MRKIEMLDKKTAQKIFNKYNLGKVKSISNQQTGITGTVFDINNKYIIKIQSDLTDKFRSERNALICNLLAKNKIKAPLLISLDISKEIIPEKYIITTKLEGKNLRDVWKNLSKNEQRKIFFEYGQLMARFHQIKMAKFGDPADKDNQFDEWPDCLKSRYQKYYNYVKQNNILPQETLNKIKEYIAKNDKLLQIKIKPVLVHNDFQAKNIKYYQGKFNGIFDFDECIGGHHEFDFLKTCLPFKREKVWLNDIIDGYKTIGTLSKKFPQRIKLYELNFCLKMFMFSHANNLTTSFLKNKFCWAIDKILTEDWNFFDYPAYLWKS